LGRATRSELLFRISNIAKKLALSLNPIHIPKMGCSWNIARILLGRCKSMAIFRTQTLGRLIASPSFGKGFLNFNNEIVSSQC
jgi:hypothetical protein